MILSILEELPQTFFIVVGFVVFLFVTSNILARARVQHLKSLKKRGKAISAELAELQVRGAEQYEISKDLEILLSQKDLDFLLKQRDKDLKEALSILSKEVERLKVKLKENEGKGGASS